MRVKPTNRETVIRDPKTRRILPPEGGKVSDSNFWRRRLRDGDVELDEGEPERPMPTGREPVMPLTTRRLPLPGVTPRTRTEDGDE